MINRDRYKYEKNQTNLITFLIMIVRMSAKCENNAVYRNRKICNNEMQLNCIFFSKI